MSLRKCLQTEWFDVYEEPNVQNRLAVGSARFNHVVWKKKKKSVYLQNLHYLKKKLIQVYWKADQIVILKVHYVFLVFVLLQCFLSLLFCIWLLIGVWWWGVEQSLIVQWRHGFYKDTVCTWRRAHFWFCHDRVESW